MPNSGKKRVRPSGRVKGDTANTLMPAMVSKLQIPKVAITRRVKDKPDASASDDQSASQPDNAASVHHAICSPKPSKRVAESAPSPPTPQPILVLDPIIPHESASLQRNLRSTASKSAHAGAGKHRVPPLENGQAIYKYMQNLAEEAGQVLPQEEERPRRKRKGKAEEGSLLQKLQESWGGMSYMQRLELAALENSEHARADSADSSAPSSPAPPPSAVGDSPMGGVVQQQEHSSRTTRAQAAASPDHYLASFAFATEPEQPKAPTPSFSHPAVDPATHASPSTRDAVASPDGTQTVRKAIPDRRHQAEAMAAALDLFLEPAGGRPAATNAPAPAQPVVRLAKRVSRKSLAGDLLPKQQPVGKQGKAATSRTAAAWGGALEPIPEPKQQQAAAAPAPAASTAVRGSSQDEAQDPKQQAAAAAAGRVSSSGRDTAQKENKEGAPAAKRCARSSVVFKEPFGSLERASGGVPATPGPTSRSFTAEDAKRARADNVAISRLQQQYEAKCDELAASQRRNTALEQQLRDAQELHSKSQQECSAKGKKCGALEKELAGSREECKKHKAAHQKAQAEKLSLAKQLEASQQEVRALRLRANQTQKAKGGQLSRVQEQHGKNTKLVAQLLEGLQEQGIRLQELDTNDSS